MNDNVYANKNRSVKPSIDFGERHQAKIPLLTAQMTLTGELMKHLIEIYNWFSASLNY